MAKINKTEIKRLLDNWATAKGQVDTLYAQREAVLKPAREKFETARAKIDKDLMPQITGAETLAADFEKQIVAEMSKGIGEEITVRQVFGDLAIAEIVTSEQREIDAGEWLNAVPKAEQNFKFFETLKVLIGKAEKYDSSIVNRIAGLKATHKVQVKLK
jgi:hypothetical protein